MPEKTMQTSLRCATLLSPVLYETYAYIARYLGERLGLETRLHTGRGLAEFAEGKAEFGFLCGLLYVHLARDPGCPMELLAAPVLYGERYQDEPCYFSDVIVSRASPHATFADLRGCVWAYNECASHSGYNLVAYNLLQRGLGLDYFGRTIASGAHLESLRLVLEGKAEATALDSHLLDALLWQQPELAERLRVVASFGPSSIPPLVIARCLHPEIKQRAREVLLAMHTDSQAVRELRAGCIKRFVAVTDERYDDIRAMFARVQASTDFCNHVRTIAV